MARLSCVMAAAGLATATPAAAVSDVSPRFDGRYVATLTPAPAMSAPGCERLTIGPFAIAQGFLRPAGDGPRLTGFVTAEGFLTGHFVRPGAPRVVIEGRFVEDGFTGGIVDDATGCAWLVTFAPGD
jgi:hypothetical protein